MAYKSSQKGSVFAGPTRSDDSSLYLAIYRTCREPTCLMTQNISYFAGVWQHMILDPELRGKAIN